MLFLLDEEALSVVTLWGRRWTRPELLARVGRLEQVAGIRLVEGGDGAERGVRMLRCWSGAGEVRGLAEAPA